MKKNELLLLLGSTTIVVFAWIGFSLYHSSVTSTVTPDVAAEIQPIAPNFDLQTIKDLKTRKRVSPQLDAQSPTTPKEAKEATKEAQPTSQITPSPTALPKTPGT